MKFLVPLIAVALMVAACEPRRDLSSDKGKLSYMVGQEIGQSLKQQGLDVDPSTLAASISDVLAGKKSAITEEEAKKIQQGFAQKRMEKVMAEAQKNKQEGDAFLEKNKTQEGWKLTSSGLQYKVVSSGKGSQPKDKDVVVVDYAGKLTNGQEFDSSFKRGQPAEFPVTGVIPGWTEALKMMHVGDKWQVVIPPNLAYGERGQPPVIPPNSVLIFDVELKNIKKPGAKGGPKGK